MIHSKRLPEVLRWLRINGPSTAASLQGALGMSQPTLSRLLGSAGLSVVRMGKTRGTSWAAIREVPGVGPRLPLWFISEAGELVEAGSLALLMSRGSWLEPVVGPGRRFEGLPPLIADMGPQGFLGRAFAQRVRELGLSPRLSDWTEEDRLHALAMRGEDFPGNLVLGRVSADRWLSQVPKPVRDADLPALAAAASQGEGGSSAAGEQPKFLTFRGGAHRLVKFAADDGGAASARWQELLVCEHHALEVLRAHQVPAARSRWLDVKGMRFLEVERFDRVGARGRRAMLSLATLDDELVGLGGTWSGLAERLAQEGFISPEDSRRLRWLDAFGAMIRNGDRHRGNQSFFPNADGTWALTPAYDMLPMSLAPVQGSVPPLEVEVPFPTVLTHEVWAEAAAVAIDFWERVAQERALSRAFRTFAGKMATGLKSR